MKDNAGEEITGASTEKATPFRRAATMRFYRRVVETLQALLILGLPFLKIGGESALRFDIPTLRLHIFGCNLWMQEFFIVLAAVIFFTLLIVFVTLVFGRIWCGWLCPQTVIVDFTSFMDRARNKSLLHKLFPLTLTFAVSAIVAANLIWYFISPYEFIPSLFHGILGSTTWGFWVVMTSVLFLNFAFLRQKWCATACPYAKVQSVLFDKSTLIIELDPKRATECINCSRCLRVCPTGVDVRKGLDAACINCAECLDACSGVMARLNKRGLIHYAFGHGGEGRVLRQSFFVVGTFLLLFFCLTAYQLSERTGVTLTVLPHTMEARLTKDGRIINAYVLSVKNMLNEPVDLKVSVDKFDDSLVQSLNEPVHLDAGKMDKIPLFVRAGRSVAVKKNQKLKINLDGLSGKLHLSEEVNFIIPDEI